jgi:hypothetical protein
MLELYFGLPLGELAATYFEELMAGNSKAQHEWSFYGSEVWIASHILDSCVSWEKAPLPDDSVVSVQAIQDFARALPVATSADVP